MKPIAIITAPCHPWLIDTLGTQFEVHYAPAITAEALQTQIPNAVGLIVTTRLKVTEQLLMHAPKLQWIGRLGSGLELIDIPACEKRGIRVVSSPEGNRNAVAEHALGMLLSVLNHMHTAMEEIKNGQWIRSANRGTELAGRTVGIIGYGHTGSQFAKLLEPFGVTVMAYDSNKHDYSNDYLREAHLTQIQHYADVISFHVPLTPETEYMCNLNFLKNCKAQPIIINTSRGKVVSNKAILQALQAGYISGACLDVLENEALDTYTAEEKETLQQLLHHKQVIITPHIAGYSHQAYLKMAQVVVQKLFATTN